MRACLRGVRCPSQQCVSHSSSRNGTAQAPCSRHSARSRARAAPRFLRRTRGLGCAPGPQTCKIGSGTSATASSRRRNGGEWDQTIQIPRARRTGQAASRWPARREREFARARDSTVQSEEGLRRLGTVELGGSRRFERASVRITDTRAVVRGVALPRAASGRRKALKALHRRATSPFRVTNTRAIESRRSQERCRSGRASRRAELSKSSASSPDGRARGGRGRAGAHERPARGSRTSRERQDASCASLRTGH